MSELQTPEKEEKPVLPPVQRALEALQILQAEEGFDATLKKRLPSLALQLDRAGEDVTVDLLLARVRAGDTGEANALKKRTYAEALAAVYEREGMPIQSRPRNPYIVALRGDLPALKQLAAEGYRYSNYHYLVLRGALEGGHIDIVKYMAEDRGYGINKDVFGLVGSVGYSDSVALVKYLEDDCGINLREGGTMQSLLTNAIKGGSLNLIKHFAQEWGMDVNNGNEHNLSLAAISNQPEVFKFLFETSDVDARRKASIGLSTGFLGIVKCVAEQGGIDPVLYQFTMSYALQRNQFDTVKYLAEECGVDLDAFSASQTKNAKVYAEAALKWQKRVRINPPRGLSDYDPAYYRPKVAEALCDFLREEEGKNYGGPYDLERKAFPAAALFGSTERVLQYFEKWGELTNDFKKRKKSFSYPLSDLIKDIKLPPVKTPEMDLAAWGDAVLNCGPSMAELLPYADKVPVPVRSEDGKNWSMKLTRDKVASFVYERGAENPELATICFEHKIPQKIFNRALDISRHVPATKNIPEITLEGTAFDMPGAVFRRLAADDLRGLFLGQYTDCCQSIGGAGEECARSGFTSENEGFYVIENAKGRIVGETWAWRGKKGELVFDSLETLGKNVSALQWKKLTQAFTQALVQKREDVSALHIGISGYAGTPKEFKDAFRKAFRGARPIGRDRYQDSKGQVIVWRANP